MSAPADSHLRTLFPFLAPISEHISFLKGLWSPLPSCPFAFSPCFLHLSTTFYPRDADLGRGCGPHVLPSDGWITHAPVYPPHPLATSPSQLAGQQPRRPGQTCGQRRRGQRRQHSLLARSRGPPGTPYSSPRDTPASPRPPPRLRPQPAILTRQPPTASRVARRAHARRFGAEDSACGGTGCGDHAYCRGPVRKEAGRGPGALMVP